MRKILVIGVGAGDPAYVTVQAVRAMNAADVFFVVDKGDVKDDLVALRKEVLDRHVTSPGYRVVELAEPHRDRTPATSAGYESAVGDWHGRRAAMFADAFATELGPDGVGALLVWGDPSLYDSTLRIFDLLADRGDADGAVPFEVEVVPGVSSVAALAARHRIILNRIGRPFLVTTGRRLREDGWPDGVPDVVVMLDAGCAFEHFTGRGMTVYWGAYLGTPDELLVAGPLDEVAGRIREVRTEARARKGWIMDTYLLRAP
jgi:precorrin-6A synthase